MIREYFVAYGCYLGMIEVLGRVECPEDWSAEQVEEALISQLYYLAREETESWHGMQGFGTSMEEYEEENPDDCSDDGYRELIDSEVEEACEYHCSPWNDNCNSRIDMDVMEFEVG